MEQWEVNRIVVDKLLAVTGKAWSVLPFKKKKGSRVFYSVKIGRPSSDPAHFRITAYETMARKLTKAGFEVRFVRGKGDNAHLDDELIVQPTKTQLEQWANEHQSCPGTDCDGCAAANDSYPFVCPPEVEP